MTTKRISVTTAPAEATQPQLILVLDEAAASKQWHLDDETIKIGREGLAMAREALRAARPAHLELAA